MPFSTSALVGELLCTYLLQTLSDTLVLFDWICFCQNVQYQISRKKEITAHLNYFSGGSKDENVKKSSVQLSQSYMERKTKG